MEWLSNTKGDRSRRAALIHHTSFGQPINKSPTTYNSFDFSGTTEYQCRCLRELQFSKPGLLWRGVTDGWPCAAELLWVSSVASIEALMFRCCCGITTGTFILSIPMRSPKVRRRKMNRGSIGDGSTAINRRLFYTAYVDAVFVSMAEVPAYQPSAGSESLLLAQATSIRRGIDFFVQFRDERKTGNPTCGCI